MIVQRAPIAGGPTDRDKIDYIYREFYPLMRAVAGKTLDGSGQEADDAVQDAMIKIIKNAAVIDVSDRDKLRNLCCVIVRNCALDRIRKRERKNVPLSDVPDEFEGAESPPEQSVISGDTLEAIIKAIGILPAIYRDVCMLKYVHDCKNKDIAALLGIPEMTVGIRIHRGKMILRETLRKEGYHE